MRPQRRKTTKQAVIPPVLVDFSFAEISIFENAEKVAPRFEAAPLFVAFAAIMPDSNTQLNELNESAVRVMPENIRDALPHIGIDADSILIHARSDLNADGHWGERYLFATAERVLIVRRTDENADGENLALPNGTILRNGRKNEASAAQLEIDLDIPLRDIASTTSKTLVGSAAIEARVREHSHNGAVENGHADKGAAVAARARGRTHSLI